MRPDGDGTWGRESFLSCRSEIAWLGYEGPYLPLHPGRPSPRTSDVVPLQCWTISGLVVWIAGMAGMLLRTVYWFT